DCWRWPASCSPRSFRACCPPRARRAARVNGCPLLPLLGGPEMSLTADPYVPSAPVSPTNGAAVSPREERLVSVWGRARRRTGVLVTERWLLAAGGGLAT